VSGACLADFGHDVVCIDKDASKVARLDAGEIPIFEPGLAELVAVNRRAGRLTFTTELAGAVAQAQAVFIAVGTPSRRGDGHADLSYVYGAAGEIADALAGYTVVATKSTVPVGTGDEVERIIREARPGAAFSVVSNPEFLREGAAIQDFKHPDRIVIGTSDEQARRVMAEIYRPLYINQAPRRRRAGGRARHRPRQSNRLQVPACRAWLRRILLPEGCAGADQDRQGA
jgi:UDPglucose 6-dehydrogenase